MQTLPVSSLFHMSYGNKFDLNKMELTDYSDANAVNFVARTAKNLGVSAIVKQITNIEPYEAGAITVALGGSILSTYIQPKPFYTSQNIMVLTPKRGMSFNEKLFYCICIEKNKNRYSAFGREANRTLKDLQLPSNVPSWVGKIVPPAYNDISEPIIKKDIKITADKWAWFKYSDLFDIERGRGARLKDLNISGKHPFVTSTDQNNGWTGWTDDEPTHNENVISVTRNGSVGEAFYQPKAFCSTEDVHIFNPKFELNPYVALFLTTLIRKEKYRYNYGRKWGLQRMSESLIKLPITKDGNPDWNYMENYMKSLLYSASIKND